MIQAKGTVPMQRLGFAGEYRVISELLLRGLAPSRVLIDEGIDLILENGKTIQVKTRRKSKRGYKVSFFRNHKEKIADYYVLWLLDDDIFLVIPKDDLNKGGHINIITDYLGGYSYPRSKFAKFKNAWHLIT